MTGPETGAGTGGRTRTCISTRVDIGARTGAGTGERTEARIEMVLEGIESLEAYEVVREVRRKMREGGRRQGVTSNRSRKTQRPSETVASC